MRIVRSGLLPLALLGMSGFAAAANAGPSMNQPPRVVVAVGDLDLSTEAGVRAAQARVRRAAELVCDDYPRIGILLPVAVERCRAAAVRDANARIASLVPHRSKDGMALASARDSMR